MEVAARQAVSVALSGRLGVYCASQVGDRGGTGIQVRQDQQQGGSEAAIPRFEVKQLGQNSVGILLQGLQVDRKAHAQIYSDRR